MPAISQCPENIIFLHDGPKCCEDITCPPGQQPVSCTSDDPSSTKCEVCPSDTYNPDPAVLSASDTCILKTQCTGPYMSYTDRGSTVHDARCECHQGYHLTRDQMHCDRNAPCPPGSGQDGKGGCVTCALGWFSDRHDEDQVCTQHTNCFRISKCIVRPGTAASDVRCGDCTTANASLNDPFKISYTSSPSLQLSSSPSPPGHGQHNLSLGASVGIGVASASAFIFIIFIYCYCRRKNACAEGREKKKTTKDPVAESPRHIIDTYRCYIVENLDPLLVIDSLIENAVVSDEDRQRINSHVTRQEKNRELLGIVKRGGETALSHFFAALSARAPYILDEIKGTNYGNIRQLRGHGDDVDPEETIPLKPVDNEIPDKK